MMKCIIQYKNKDDEHKCFCSKLKECSKCSCGIFRKENECGVAVGEYCTCRLCGFAVRA
ncbi:hypothetical protein [Clostridium sp. YIM B02500]|uniref:hypothetical protein n=1 Tax=Clostridium sp. YIM B02500 TaxID=2910681 RepID=UPI001EEE0B5F|nr:hypothetical protein [Clostridium sp. YIM B02500]